jgi:hypothetical protein
MSRRATKGTPAKEVGRALKLDSEHHHKDIMVHDADIKAVAAEDLSQKLDVEAVGATVIDDRVRKKRASCEG